MTGGDVVYFYYLRSMPDGHWAPQISAADPESLPSIRNTKGQPPRHSPAVKLGPLDWLTLSTLTAKYPPPAPLPVAEPTAPVQPTVIAARPRETIGGGFVVLTRAPATQRLRMPIATPFEHATLQSAEDEARAYARQNPGEVFEVWSSLSRYRAETRPTPARSGTAEAALAEPRADLTPSL